MGFFSNMYTKEGPGVRKDQPPKKGIPRFFEILMRDYGHLLKVNFLFLLCCLPMVTVVLFGLLFHQYLGMLLIAAVLYLLCAVLVGPAMTCLHGITVKTVRDEPCYMWHEFKKCWKGNWKQSVPAGVLFTTLQMLYLDMPLGGMLKNSLLIMFGYAKRTLPAGLITLVIVIGVVLFVPVPIMLLLLFLGMPALVAVIGDMWAWPVMEQAFHISEQQAARRAEQEGRE